ncbi:MAG TPA: Ig-like domain-containing protein, partial [Rhodanobacter sp.]|nr:Ig-like domain-containing protein [Rhodanobacter sp.]
EAVTVNTGGGTPRIAITLDTGGTVYADYVSGSGTSALTFRYTVASGNLDTNGIAVGALGGNGGTLKDAAGNDATLTLNSVGSTAAVLVDAVVPTADIVVADNSLKVGETSQVTITFSEAVSGFSNADLTVANGTLSAVSSSDGGVTWTATFTPTAGVTDASNLITLDNTGVQDATGNAGVGSTDSNNYAIDTLRPTATIVVADTALAAGETSTATITFSEAVSGLTTADLTVANGSLSGLASSDSGITWTATFTPTADITDASNLITLDNTGVQDAAGNAGTGSTDSNNYAIDTQPPVVVSVAVPADSTYIAGQNLDFTVDFSDVVIVDTGSGTPRIAVILESGGTAYADYLSGSGSTALLFRLTASSGQMDADGITLGSSIDSHGGSIRDTAGNAIVAGLNGVAATTGVRVDAIEPGVARVDMPADGHYNAGDVLSFSVTTSEAVLVDSAGGTPRLQLDIGGSTAYADYVSGSGSDTLVFQYTVRPGDKDADGIALTGAIDPHGAQLHDAAGNQFAPALHGIADGSGVIVDTTAPQVMAISRDDGSPNSGQQGLSYTVTFDESVDGVDAADFALVATGNAHATIGAITRIDGHSFTVQLQDVVGSGSLQLNLAAAGSGIADTAGNALVAGANGEVYVVGGVTPVVLPPPTVLPMASGITHGNSVSLLTALQPDDLPTIFFGEAAPTPLFTLPIERFGGVLDSLATLSHESISSFGNAVRDASAWPPSTWVAPNRPFSVRLPGALDGQHGVLQVSLADGRPLPSWLHFDPVADTLDGVPPADFSGTLSLQLTVLDGHGQVRNVPLELSTTTDRAPSRPGHVNRPANNTDSKPVATAKPALQIQFGQQRQHGNVDHASLLHHLAVARQQQASAQARP